MYADDTQLYMDFRDSQENAAMSNLNEIVKFGKQYSKEDIQICSTSSHTQPCVTSIVCTLDMELNMSMHAI